jgi:excisionase family DNA binding protein
MASELAREQKRRQGRPRGLQQRPEDAFQPVGPPLLSVYQLGKRLNLCRGAVLRLFKTGALPAMKLGGVWRVEREALEAYMERAKTWRKAEGSAI